ncbi:DNA-binding transcriptional regulator AraC [compost metagenome]
MKNMKEVECNITTELSWLKAYASNLSKAFNTPFNLKDNKVIFPDSVGSGEIGFYAFEDNFGLIRTKLYLKESFIFIRNAVLSNDYSLIHYNVSARKIRLQKPSGIEVDYGNDWNVSIHYLSAAHAGGFLFTKELGMGIITLVMHRTWIQRNLSKYFVSEGELSTKFLDNESVDGYLHIDLESMKIVKNILALNDDTNWYAFLMEGYAYKLLSIFIRRMMKKEFAKEKLSYKDVIRVIDLKEQLEQKIGSPWPKIEIVAESCHMSRSKFLKVFKSVFGKNYYDLYQELRMQKAAELLISGFSISETAKSVGIVNPSHFAKEFKGFFYIDPSSYK